ncbi:MAG: hypothetical protein WDO73_11015 [Ignavibacteriota bacterium]
MSRLEGDHLRREERTAVFLALAGIGIQRKQGSGPVSSRRLYKVLANCIWDWAFLPDASQGKIRVGNPGDLVWVPYRYGSLGHVMPTICYKDIELLDGLFVHPVDLFRCPQYSKYGIKVVTGQNGRPALQFPNFLPFKEQTHSGVQHVDLNFWNEAVSFYARQPDDVLDALASCRTETATSLNLWTQLMFWKEDTLKAAQLLRDTPNFEVEPVRNRLQRISSDAFGAASQFSIKAAYWRTRDHVVLQATSGVEPSEIGEFVPIRSVRSGCPAAARLPVLLGMEDCVRSCNNIVRFLFGRLAIVNPTFDIEQAEQALEAVSKVLPEKLPFQPFAVLAYQKNSKAIGQYVEDLVRLFCDYTSLLLDLGLYERRLHFREFVKYHYPLNIAS